MAGVSRQGTGIPGRDALDHHAARAAFAVEVRPPAPSLRANGSAPTGRANARPMTGSAPPDEGSAKQSILSLRIEKDCFVARALPCANASRLSQTMTMWRYW